jgi:hypothetical protein
MTADQEVQRSIEEHGFAIGEAVLTEDAVAALLIALDGIDESASVRKRGGVFAVRNLLDESSSVCELANSEKVRGLVAQLLGPHFFPVRGILFDKIPDANWKVPWHQDLTIAVREKIEVEGFGPWSVKLMLCMYNHRGRFWKTCLRCDFILIHAMRRTAPCA